MISVSTSGSGSPVSLPASPAQNNAPAEAAISLVFSDFNRPKMAAVGEVTYGSDGIKAVVSKPEAWKSGNYITFSRDYSDSPRPVVTHYNVSGTGPNGEYIPPHTITSNGAVSFNAPSPQAFRIHQESRMASLLDLRSAAQVDEQGKTYYTREGFSGRYYLQTEQDGQVSVLYSGGRHVSGANVPPQTFVNGSWDLARREPYSSGSSSYVGLRVPRFAS